MSRSTSSQHHLPDFADTEEFPSANAALSSYTSVHPLLASGLIEEDNNDEEPSEIEQQHEPLRAQSEVTQSTAIDPDQVLSMQDLSGQSRQLPYDDSKSNGYSQTLLDTNQKSESQSQSFPDWDRFVVDSNPDRMQSEPY